MASFVSVYEDSLCALRASGGLERFMKDFKALTDNLSRVQMVQAQEWLPNFVMTSSNQEKNNIKAHKLADQAQRQVKLCNTGEALKLVNSAIQLAPHPRPEHGPCPGTSHSQNYDVLCRAYALRAKNFFNMHHYHSAALDAQRSLSFTLHPYAPTQVQTMVVLMKSLRHIGKQQDAERLLEHYLSTAAAAVGGDQLDGATKDELEEAAFGESLGSYADARCFPLSSPTPPKLSHPAHAASECLSGAVTLTHEGDGRGRRMVANRDINIGDVVIVDPAFCTSLKPEFFGTHCLHCFIRLEAPVPCYQCSTVFFCGERCRDLAWKTTHAAECSHLDALTTDHIGCMALLAYRAVTVAGVENLLSRAAAAQQPAPDAFWAPGDPLSKLTGLEQHDGDRPVGDMLKRTVTAIYLESCMEFGPGFPAPSRLGPDGRDRLAAALLGLLQSLSCNAYEIAETVVSRADVRGAEGVQLGGAVYPVVSMTNHSCSPNVMRVSCGTTCVVRAVRPIRAGEEILDNYGYFYHSMAAQDRRERLRRQYFFTCNCTPCHEDWPTVEALKPAEYKFFCPACKRSFPASSPASPPSDSPARCTNCGKDVDAEKQRRRWAELRGQLVSMGKSVLAGKLEGVVPRLGLVLGVLDKLAEEPSKDALEACLLLKQCYNLEGNVHWVP